MLVHTPAHVQLLARIVHAGYCVVLATGHLSNIEAVREIVKLIGDAEL
jgi:hypothetical protein